MEWLETQAFFLCFPLKLLPCREPCPHERNKGFAGEIEEQATEVLKAHKWHKYCKTPHADSNLEKRGSHPSVGRESTKAPQMTEDTTRQEVRN